MGTNNRRFGGFRPAYGSLASLSVQKLPEHNSLAGPFAGIHTTIGLFSFCTVSVVVCVCAYRTGLGDGGRLCVHSSGVVAIGFMTLMYTTAVGV